MYIESFLNLLMNQRQNAVQSLSYHLWMNLHCFLVVFTFFPFEMQSAERFSARVFPMLPSAVPSYLLHYYLYIQDLHTCCG